jgi:hypothetical protein
VLAEDGGVEELAIRLGGSLHPPILLDLSRNRESCRIAQRPPRGLGRIHKHGLARHTGKPYRGAMAMPRRYLQAP